MINKNTVSSLTGKEAELAARMSYEKKDIVTAPGNWTVIYRAAFLTGGNWFTISERRKY